MTLFETKARTYVPRLMKDLDITRTQACGIFGNLGTETGGFLHLQELKPVVAGSKGGYGWMQWTGPRRRAYEAYCASKNILPAADESNYQYLVHETLTAEKHSLVQLRKTTSLDAATYTFMKLNLRPGVEHISSRKKYAEIADKATIAAVANKPSTVKEEEKAVKQTSGVAAPGLIAILAAFFTDYWPAVLVAGAVLSIGGYYLMGWYHEYQEKQRQEEIERIKAQRTPKKGNKKNG